VTPREWDAATYDRVSEPQLEWGREVLDRLPLRGDERVLDAGCGSGRVTAELASRLPRGQVVAVDSSAAMVARASQALGPGAEVIQSDLLDLELAEPVDAVFSTATFHWILDHDRLFARLHAALRPGGRLLAQCGGEGNVARFVAVSEKVAQREPYRGHLHGFEWGTFFAGPGETAQRLESAGFVDFRCWLSEAPVVPPEPPAFLTCVCCGPHLERLPAPLHDRFVADVLAELGDPPVLDYVRLNIEARRAQPGA
jgi:trans-aconitate 2-methyltransferase